MIEGQQTLSASSLSISGKALTGEEYSAFPPKEMTEADIAEQVQEFAAAAKRSIEAGFDGVEIHGANGYLLDQFINDNTNLRADSYGGSAAARAKLPLEVIKAVTSAIGASRTGIRLSPFNYYQDTKDSDPMSHWGTVCDLIAELPKENRLAYVHMVEPRFDETLSEEAKIASLPKLKVVAVGAGVQENAPGYSLLPFAKTCRAAGIKFLSAGGFTRDTALKPLEADETDAVVFGRWFIANPDLPRRLKEGLELNAYDRSSFYGANPPEKGYTDYPFYS